MQPLIRLPQNFSDLTAPVYGYLPLGETDNDLTRQHAGEPLGERIIVAGRVVQAGWTKEAECCANCGSEASWRPAPSRS